MNTNGLQSTDLEYHGIQLGNSQFDTDYMRQCAWTPSDTGTERVPQAVDFPMAEAFKDYQQ